MNKHFTSTFVNLNKMDLVLFILWWTGRDDNTLWGVINVRTSWVGCQNLLGGMSESCQNIWMGCQKAIRTPWADHRKLLEPPGWDVRKLSKPLDGMSESHVWEVRKLSESTGWDVRFPWVEFKIPWCDVIIHWVGYQKALCGMSESPWWDITKLSESHGWDVRILWVAHEGWIGRGWMIFCYPVVKIN